MMDGMRHLRAFLAVARLESFTRAANQLNLSQPALTVQIQQLEDSLGVILFNRNKRHVALTKIGRDLVGRFERILREVESVLDTTRNIAELRSGLVTTIAIPPVAARLLPMAIRRFSARFPGIAVRIYDGRTPQVLDRVKAGTVDFGIGCYISRSTNQQNTNLSIRRLFTEELCVFVPLTHRFASKRSIEMCELSTETIVTTGKDTSARLAFDKAVEQEQLLISPTYEIDYVSTAVGMVSAGLGLAILPRSAVFTSSCSRVRRVKIRKPQLTRDIHLIVNTGRTLSAAAEKLIETLASCINRANT